MRPLQGATGGAVALAAGRERAQIVVLHVERRAARQVGLQRAGQRQFGPREDTAGRRTAAQVDGGLYLGDGGCARGGDGDAGLGHDALEAVEAGRIAHALREQAVALLHGPLELADAGPVAGIEAGDQAIEEAAALGCGAHEQAVHGRRQPHHLDVVGERAGARLVLAVDAHDAAAAPAGLRAGRAAGADVDAAVLRAQVRGNRPARFADLGQLLVGCAAQALAGREQRQRLQQIGLAGAVRPAQHDGLRSDAEGEAGVVAEGGEMQPLDPRAGRGRAAYGLLGKFNMSDIGHLARSDPAQTRIGMST